MRGQTAPARFVKASHPKDPGEKGTVDGIIDKRVKAEGGEEGTVVAVAHGGGGGFGGWQLLILQDNGRLTVAGAMNAQIGP
jgi:hypothetical protein